MPEDCFVSRERVGDFKAWLGDDIFRLVSVGDSPVKNWRYYASDAPTATSLFISEYVL